MPRPRRSSTRRRRRVPPNRPRLQGARPSARTTSSPRPAMVTPPQPRPAGLPDPFEKPVAGAWSGAAPQRPKSAAFDDPFSLDPLPSQKPASVAQPAGFSDFDLPPAPAAPAPSPQPAPPANAWPDRAVGARSVRLAGAGASEGAARSIRAGPAAAAGPAATAGGTGSGRARLRHATPGATDAPGRRPGSARGLPARPWRRRQRRSARDPLAEMEAFGREYRMMMEGLMHLLRKRAEEKGNARIAQTVIGALEVNPLKFLPTVEAALARFMARARRPASCRRRQRSPARSATSPSTTSAPGAASRARSAA